MMAELDLLNGAYEEFLAEMKLRIHEAQQGVVLRVNQELIMLYWEIGREILERQANRGWGGKVIDRLADDLRRSFPEVTGFSARNLKYMRRLAEEWPDSEFVQQAVAQIPWGHTVRLLDKVADPEERVFYIEQTIANAWSRNVLVAQIESGLYRRQGKALTNFERTLPSPQSDLARQTLKDPYIFDFLEMTAGMQERDLERELVGHVQQFLLELGVGFAFIGRQVPLVVGGDDFYLDLLFYHIRLRSFVVVELKSGPFKPEHAGKLSFYLSAVDEQLRDREMDGPTIGLLLCKEKNRVVVEYALRDNSKPIGVASWELTRALPAEFEGRLPRVEDLESELEDD